MPRRVLQGTVLSDKCDKTVIVKVDRKVKNAKYKKIVTKSKKYAVHDQDNSYTVGSSVYIRECRPISKRKRWEAISNLKV